MNYDTYILAIKALEAMSSEHSSKLKELRGGRSGPMGLTPDSIKFSPEYQQSKRAFDATHNQLRKLNSLVPKEYLKRRAKDRREGRMMQ